MTWPASAAFNSTWGTFRYPDGGVGGAEGGGGLLSRRAHAEEVRRRRALLTPEQRREAAYAFDLSYWAQWFAFEHEEARRRGVREVDRSVLPPLLVAREEDQEAEAAY